MRASTLGPAESRPDSAGTSTRNLLRPLARQSPDDLPRSTNRFRVALLRTYHSVHLHSPGISSSLVHASRSLDQVCVGQSSEQGTPVD
jgi:hypothetical protein